MTAQPIARYVTSVLVETDDDSVTVTWGLGDVAPGDVEYFGYGVDYFGPDGNGGKRFSVRFHEKPSASAFDWTSSTNANYEPEAITVHDDRIVVHYRDASLGLPEIGIIRAYSHVNGEDLQTELPVTLLR